MADTEPTLDETNAMFDLSQKKKKKKKKTEDEASEDAAAAAASVDEITAKTESLKLSEDAGDGFGEKKKKKKKKPLTEEDDSEVSSTGAGAPATAVEASGEDDLGLEKKKKKKKKKDFDPDEEVESSNTGDRTPMDGGDENDFDADIAADAPDNPNSEDPFSGKKKKKKTAKMLADDDDEDDGMFTTDDKSTTSKATLQPGAEAWIGSDRDYHYEELLQRVFQIMRAKNPEAAAGEKRRFVMKPPQVTKVGTRKCALVNFAEICKLMHRSPTHVIEYILAELGTTGSVDSQDQLIIRGRYQQKQMESVLRHYIREYVTCHTCRSPDTSLFKENRLYFLKCETCNSKCTVAAIKSGFQAVTGKRANLRAAEN